MQCLQGVQSQLGSCWEGAYSQASSCWDGVKASVGNCCSGIEHYTNQAARCIFGQDRSAGQRNIVLCNFVLPVSLTLGTLALLFSAQVAMIAALVCTVFILIIAKKNAVI